MKNFIKEGQKLPLYGIGPHLVAGMALVTLAGILLTPNLLRSGAVSGAWRIIFHTLGGLLMVLGLAVWLISAKGSGMDESIAENKLKTDGIYAWVRNPMYSGLWLLMAGICLQWCNAWLLAIPFLNWALMTAVLKHTEEKWLSELYGPAYAAYCRRVNRCWPWFPRKDPVHTLQGTGTRHGRGDRT